MGLWRGVALAPQAGVRILERGRNAVDAANCDERDGWESWSDGMNGVAALFAIVYDAKGKQAIRI